MTANQSRLAVLIALAGTVLAANWALNRYGIVPVGFGLHAPAGVYAAGLAFGLRDFLHELGGRRWVIAAIAVGASLSYAIEDSATIPGGHAPIAIASAAAFALSELADFAVYDRVRGRSRLGAVALSNTVGAAVDSALFLWLAFGALDHLTGNAWGKLLMTAPAVLAMWGVRRRALSRDCLGAEGA